jgi:hypothetical protein
MTLNTTDSSSGVSIVSGSQITVANTGVYNLQFSAQYYRTSGTGTDVVSIWLRKNGSDIPQTCTDIVITGTAVTSPLVPAWNFVMPLVAGDYLELYWCTPDTYVRIVSVAARTGPVRPEIPGLIVTLTQVA